MKRLKKLRPPAGHEIDIKADISISDFACELPRDIDHRGQKTRGKSESRRTRREKAGREKRSVDKAILIILLVLVFPLEKNVGVEKWDPKQKGVSVHDIPRETYLGRGGGYLV